ncbi:translation initiation factor [archaeon]|nr:translation initiation factor [archaeon]
MSDIDPITGLPKEIGAWESITKESQRIKVRTVKRRFGKLMTLIEGLDSKEINMRDLTKTLKSKLACGGTNKGNTVELQGNHKKKAKEELVKYGFASETISVE